MEIIKFVNTFTSNTYILKYNDNVYIIDPGDENMNKVIKYLKDNNLKLSKILLTHCHFDHIIGLPSILEYSNVDIYLPLTELEFLKNPNLSLLNWCNFKQEKLDKALENANLITYLNGDNIDGIKIISTPGHSIGSSCFYIEEKSTLISGDTLFKGSYGRYDLPTSSSRDLWKSIGILLKLPLDTKVYPGHGDDTTIRNEYNIYYSMY